MTTLEIYNLWTEFINNDNYKIYFISNIDVWKTNLDMLKQYIDTHKKRPASENKDKNIAKLGSWILNQNNNYAKNDRAMNNIKIKNAW